MAGGSIAAYLVFSCAPRPPVLSRCKKTIMRSTAYFPDLPDVAILGAGAAGVAAGRALLAQGASVLILEARERAGGRAYTFEGSSDFPLDLGCGWLHSADRNPLVELAGDSGFTVDKTLPPWQDVRAGEGFGPGEHAAFRDAQGAFYARMEEEARAPNDRPANELLEPGGRWNAAVDAVSTYVNGTELARLSVKDFDAYCDTEVNYRVTQGYGALIARLAQPLPIRFGCAAQMVDRSGARLRVVTPQGDLEARAVIVALPTNVLASGGVRISPEPSETLHAAANLPLGVADKLFLSVEGAHELPENGRLFGATDRVGTGAYHYRPFDRPLIEGYFGGACARELESGGMAAFADFAIEELCGALGSRWRARLAPVACSAWARDPFALGSYSHALPGHWDKRAVLAAPVENRIFFAGEATHPHFFSTAHGAWMSGERAAAEALRALAGAHQA
ncbi:MAG: FAD-dependent oxidoreductase [Hyphomicrobiales bacterium]|nr:FAD-dependent oxidoreductase [Hyphomicrobiales bacterium]